MSGFHHYPHQTKDPPFRETGKKPLSNKGLKKPTLHLSYLAQTPEEIFTSRFLRRWPYMDMLALDINITNHLSSPHDSIVAHPIDDNNPCSTYHSIHSYPVHCFFNIAIIIIIAQNGQCDIAYFMKTKKLHERADKEEKLPDVPFGHQGAMRARIDHWFNIPDCSQILADAFDVPVCVYPDVAEEDSFSVTYLPIDLPNKLLNKPSLSTFKILVKLSGVLLNYIIQCLACPQCIYHIYMNNS
ncbi:hypothetical protein BDB01DRAFT_837022 [Pilobolus umbonatus]|nr:hypothetical protein BDB01DRAFT_837022 [Pilobolus umbonatus]